MPRTRWSSAAAIIAGLSIAFTAIVQESAPGAAQVAPSSAPASRPSEAASATDEVVDKILTRLENREVNDLRAKVTWELGNAIEEDETNRKIGEIWYRQEQPVAKFKVHFRKKINDGRATDIDEQHLFDGQIYVELNSQTKTVLRREIRDEKDKSNPYKIGEGAFPLPFGQKKDDILREFEVTRLKTQKGDPEKTDRLKLIPRKGTRSASRYSYVEFWVVQEDGATSGLPIKVKAAQMEPDGKPGSILIITFGDVTINTGVGAVPFRVETPDGYEEIFEALPDPPALEIRPPDAKPARNGD